jgi:hypothetical protein
MCKSRKAIVKQYDSTNELELEIMKVAQEASKAEAEKANYLPFNEYVREFIKDRLPDYKGREIYADDLPFYICEGISADGTATCSTAKAQKYLFEWSGEAGDYMEWNESEFGKSTNPFNNPEAFMVGMIRAGVEIILQQVSAIAVVLEMGIEPKIMLDDATIAAIIAEVEYLDVEF